MLHIPLQCKRRQSLHTKRIRRDSIYHQPRISGKLRQRNQIIRADHLLKLRSHHGSIIISKGKGKNRPHIPKNRIFDRFIKLGKGEEKSGGRERETILGDLFEAFLGALLLDKGLEVVKDFIYQVMIPKVEAGDFEQVTDYKTKLQELLQSNGDVEILYQVVSESGPAHAKNFEVSVSVDGRLVGKGQGRSKKLAEQEAAKNAFEKENHSCI
mgnify:CR=1 FL=1